eukprot:SAG11_NODE_7787_length_1096_cov_1.289870_1_plen_109_part_10
MRKVYTIYLDALILWRCLMVHRLSWTVLCGYYYNGHDIVTAQPTHCSLVRLAPTRWSRAAIAAVSALAALVRVEARGGGIMTTIDSATAVLEWRDATGSRVSEATVAAP